MISYFYDWMRASAWSQMSWEALENVVFMQTKLSDRFFPIMKSDFYDQQIVKVGIDFLRLKK